MNNPREVHENNFVLEAEELRNILLQLPETLSDEEMDEMLRAGDKVKFNIEAQKELCTNISLIASFRMGMENLTWQI